MLVGIDLGTTHSLIAHCGPEGPALIPNALGEALTPSVVAVDEQGGVLVGQAAKDRLITHPTASVATFKRWMGSARQTPLGTGQYRPEQLSALVLRSLLDDARAHLGTDVTEAVISVPAYFSDAQRKATRQAGEMAGVKVELLVNEPTAAALAYGLQQLDRESRFLVFDLGGGTLDVSILEMFEGVVEVRASAGDNWLGGEDFLEVLLKDFESRCLPPQGLKALDAGLQAQLRRRLEQAKKQLSTDDRVALENLCPAQTAPWQMTPERFAQLCEPLLQRMRMPLERAIRDANLKPSQIDEVILVGGASRMPMVAQLVARMMGRLPLRHVNPDHAIALGAAAAAGMKANDQRLREVVLTDVCPYSLGTDVGRQLGGGKVDTGYFHPIIPRNCTVPVSREESFYPLSEKQTQVVIGVYQGESPWVRNNIQLGELAVPLGPTGQAERGVRVRFTYDVNGILQVEAWPLAGGERHELLLQQGEATLSVDELRARIAALDALKVHPRDQQENVALLARAERVYEEYIHDRPDVQQWIVLFRQALETQDLRVVKEHREALRERLDGVESTR